MVARGTGFRRSLRSRNFWWVVGSGRGRGFEGDPEAEGFELTDVAAFLDVGIDAAIVMVCAEVVEVGVGVARWRSPKNWG